jgi:nucleotide-binding universal stress UspA family protein
MRPGAIVLAVPADAGVAAGLAFAIAESRRRSAVLRLVHVFDAETHEPASAAGRPVAGHAYERAIRLLHRIREQAEALGAPDVELGCLPRDGSLRSTLVVASGDAGMIVLQRRALGPLRRLASRSTSSGVAARAHAPVVVVPESATEHAGTMVTVGVDAPDRSGNVLSTALEVARTRSATLRVVHALWTVGGYDDVLVERATARRREAEAERDVRQAVQLAMDRDPASSGLKVDLDVRHQHPGDLLLGAAEDSALIILGRHDTALPVGSHLGPVCGSVLRESPCPVMIVDP